MNKKLSLIDTHCHLSMISTNTDTILRNAKTNGVNACIDVAVQEEDWPKIISNIDKYPSVYGSIGIHPKYAQTAINPTHNNIIQNITHPKIIAIGETGLDYSRHPTHKEIQKKAFMEHIYAAQKLNLPVIVHTRDADKDTIECLQEGMYYQKFQAIIHCFSGSLFLAEEALNLGCYISFSGIITFDNSRHWNSIIKYFPIDKILLETDSPFLSPVPYRSQENQPGLMIHTAKKLASIYQLDLPQIAHITSKNSRKLFNLPFP